MSFKIQAILFAMTLLIMFTACVSRQNEVQILPTKEQPKNVETSETKTEDIAIKENVVETKKVDSVETEQTIDQRVYV